MIRVCHKHYTVTHGILGCRKCRQERHDAIVERNAEATRKAIKEIFKKRADSLAQETRDDG